jgi:myo-inositol-1(or 4)-monophosphatase
MDIFREMYRNSQGVRRLGSAALDLCYTACGRLDGFWEFDLSPWDVAAGILIVSEAGGKLSDFSGNNFSIYGKQVLATNGIIESEMLKILSLT